MQDSAYGEFARWGNSGIGSYRNDAAPSEAITRRRPASRTRYNSVSPWHTQPWHNLRFQLASLSSRSEKVKWVRGYDTLDRFRDGSSTRDSSL